VAKEPSVIDTEDEWEDVKVGIGDQWDFETQGVLIGHIVGKFPIDLPERSWSQNPDGTTRKVADAWKFALRDTGEEVFIWDSYALSDALTEPGFGDLVRIQFEGYKDFDNGKKRVKKYKVQVQAKK
jgi:hypothetical protein